MKPKAIFKRIEGYGFWILLNWRTPEGLGLRAPTLSSLIDAATEFSPGTNPGNQLAGTNPASEGVTQHGQSCD